MAPSSKANYKTFEAQARLIRAIVAAHPDTKWNYKEIAACYGSDMTESALNHRFRPLRAEVIIIAEGRKRGLDMKDLKVGDDVLPKKQSDVDKKNISKYFGSTPDGIQFQFRGIKTDAKRIRKTVEEGGDAADCPIGGETSSASTPAKSTPAKRAGCGRKRKKMPMIKDELLSDFAEEEDDDETDGELIDSDTPAKKRRSNATDAAHAKKIRASPVKQEKVSDSFSDPEQQSVAPSSIFGNTNGAASTIHGNGGFNDRGLDTLINGHHGPDAAAPPSSAMGNSYDPSYDIFDGYSMDPLDDTGEI